MNAARIPDALIVARDLASHVSNWPAHGADAGNYERNALAKAATHLHFAPPRLADALSAALDGMQHAERAGFTETRIEAKACAAVVALLQSLVPEPAEQEVAAADNAQALPDAALSGRRFHEFRDDLQRLNARLRVLHGFVAGLAIDAEDGELPAAVVHDLTYGLDDATALLGWLVAELNTSEPQGPWADVTLQQRPRTWRVRFETSQEGGAA